jgi:hypothetical protein
MTRSHVLLHCPNERARAARAGTWEGRDPGGVRLLLANPSWERRSIKFLEIPGVGRVMADGTDEDGARASRIDEWVVWETRRGKPLGTNLQTFFCSFLYLFCQGTHTQGLAHSAQRTAEVPELVSFLLFLSLATYPLGINGNVARSKQTNKPLRGERHLK